MPGLENLLLLILMGKKSRKVRTRSEIFLLEREERSASGDHSALAYASAAPHGWIVQPVIADDYAAHDA